jgi:hypothetical protein
VCCSIVGSAVVQSFEHTRILYYTMMPTNSNHDDHEHEDCHERTAISSSSSTSSDENGVGDVEACMVGDGDGDATSDAPLALKDLQRWMSSETYQWLEEVQDQDQVTQRKCINDNVDDDNDNDDDAAAYSCALFGNHSNTNGEEEDESFSDKFLRVREWTSSAHNADGIGGYYHEDDTDNENNEEEQYNEHEQVNEHEVPVVKVKYILSDAAGGHGDDLWAASRHLANQLANPDQCRELLHMSRTGTLNHKHDGEQQQSQLPQSHHPLVGLSMVELGAGGGLPSFTAMQCGCTRVVWCVPTKPFPIAFNVWPKPRHAIMGILRL